MLAPAQTIPETILVGVDDWQVPNITTEWLGEVLEKAVKICDKGAADYDGHYCTFREQAGFDALEAFVGSL